MISPLSLTLGLLVLLPKTQDKRPSAATLLEQARILAEEKAEPKAALEVLLNKIICRSDLSKAQFDKAARMISIYSGGKPPAASAREAQNPLPRQDLARLIEKEIDDYLGGKRKARDNILWYGKPALPVLIARLRRTWFKAGVAELLVPLIFSDIDPRGTASFLRDLRERGPKGLRTVVALNWTARSLRDLETVDKSWEPLLEELMLWVRSTEEWENVLWTFSNYLKPDDLVQLLLEKKAKWDPILVAELLTSRKDIVRLKNPKPLFRIVLREADKAYAGKPAYGLGRYIFLWLLRQNGGFEVFVRVLGVRDWSMHKDYKTDIKTLHSFPDAEHGLVALFSQMMTWGNKLTPYMFLDYCLRNVWKDPIDRPSPELRKHLLEAMGILNRRQREIEVRSTKGLKFKYMWGALKGLLLLRVAGAPQEFQESLWKAAIGDRIVPRFPDLGLKGGSRPRYEPGQWGVGALLLSRVASKKPLLPTTMSDEAKLRLYLHNLAMGNVRNARDLFLKLETVFLPEATREKLLQALLSTKDLFKNHKKLRGKNVWALIPRAWAMLPQAKARSVLQEILEDASIPGPDLTPLLELAIAREEDPVAFLTWVRAKRKGLAPDAFLWIESPKRSMEYFDLLTAWILEDPSAVDMNPGGVDIMVVFSGLLRAYPSKKGETFLGTLLLSNNKSVREAARQVLDDWKRIAVSRAQSESEGIRAQLWKKTANEHGISVRTLALKGLFALSDKRAWLLLSDWLESKDADLKQAAEAMAAQIRAGK